MKLSRAAASRVRQLCEDVILLDGEQDDAPSLSVMAREAKLLLDSSLRESRRPVKRVAGPSRKESKRIKEDAEAAANAEVYKAVKRRDRGCTVQLPESIMGPCSGPLQIDHQWGRGKEETRVENCRRLCEGHHRRKTDGKPNRLTWLYDYAEHCLALAGLAPAYLAEVEKAQNLAQLEKAQHPEARSSASEAAGK